MRSPDVLIRENAAPVPNGPTPAPTLRLVKPAGRSRELTALEREFLPPLLELEETPPSPVQRKCSGASSLGHRADRLGHCRQRSRLSPRHRGKFIPTGA